MILHQAATNKYVSTVHRHILCGHNHFALSTSDLAQYRIITIYSISTIVQYIQCTVNIQYTISSSGPMNEVEAEVSYEFIGKLF